MANRKKEGERERQRGNYGLKPNHKLITKWNEMKRMKGTCCVWKEMRVNEEFLWSGTESDKPTNAFNFCKCCTLFGVPNSPRNALPAPLPCNHRIHTHLYVRPHRIWGCCSLLMAWRSVPRTPSAPLHSLPREASVRQCAKGAVCLSVWANYNWVQ